MHCGSISLSFYAMVPVVATKNFFSFSVSREKMKSPI
jgi:hypothetical protein